MKSLAKVFIIIGTIKIILLFHLPVMARSSSITIEVTDDATLHDLKSKEVKTLSKGKPEEVVLESPVWVKSGSGLPVMLIPLNSSNDSLKLHIPPVKEFLGDDAQREIDNHISYLLQNFAEVQRLIRSKQFDEAEVKVNSMVTKYPGVKFLNFLRASVLLVKGKREAAKNALKEGLLHHPDYIEGLSLLKTLEDGR